MIEIAKSAVAQAITQHLLPHRHDVEPIIR
jgi:hypothetical protein